MRRVVQSLTLLLPLLLVSPEVRADERIEEASQLFRKGAAAFKSGDPRGAARAFEQAHQLVPHGATLYNAGLAWQAAEAWELAAQAFHGAFELGGLSAIQSSDARVRLEVVSGKVGKLRVTAPRGARVSSAHVQNVEAPAVVFLPPGPHDIVVEFEDGTEITKSVDVVVGSVDIDIQPATKGAGGVDGTEEVSTDDPGMSRRTLGWVAVGGAGALTGAAIYLGLQAVDARDTFNDSGHTDADAHDRAASMRTWTNVAWVAAGATAITGVVLLVGADDDSEEEPAARATQLRVGASSVSLSGTF